MTAARPHIRLGGYQGPGSVLTAGLARFADELTASGAPVEVEREFDVTARGDTARSLFDALETGGFHIGYLASGYLTARVPELGVLDLPFIVEDRQAAFAALDGEAGDVLGNALETAVGLRLLGYWDNGFRHLTNRVHPILAPRDCRGLVVRTLDNRIYQETMASMGFEPVVTDVRELLEAVAAGRVDAQENPLTNTVGFELYRHHAHLSLTGHFFGIVLFVCNAAWFRDLPEPVRNRINAAAAAATEEQRRLAKRQDTHALDRLREAGVTVAGPDDLDLAAFRQACAPVRERALSHLPAEIAGAYPDR